MFAEAQQFADSQNGGAGPHLSPPPELQQPPPQPTPPSHAAPASFAAGGLGLLPMSPPPVQPAAQQASTPQSAQHDPGRPIEWPSREAAGAGAAHHQQTQEGATQEGATAGGGGARGTPSGGLDTRKQPYPVSMSKVDLPHGAEEGAEGMAVGGGGGEEEAAEAVAASGEDAMMEDRRSGGVGGPEAMETLS